jgi:protoporphyrinogen oxidase
MQTEVIIIGGGLSGLIAARELHAKKIEFKLLEATDRLGGRVKTDKIDGYRLDHGFQVLLTAYPQASKWLNYNQLDLKHFVPGALVLYPSGEMDTVGDPARDPSSLLSTMASKAGSLKDKLSILKLKQKLNKESISQIFTKKEVSTLNALSNQYGFSDKMINNFFQPFYSGIFFENDLSTSRRMFEFVFKMFSEGQVSVPNEGMGAIPRQIASVLPESNILLNSRVTSIEQQKVLLENGETITAPHIIIATEANSLIQHYKQVNLDFQSTTHLHFVSEEPPIDKGIIGINAKKDKLVTNICTISKVAPGYAPPDKNLISVSIVGDPITSEKELIQSTRKELELWFGKPVETWHHLHTRKINYALPRQTTVSNNLSEKDFVIREGLYCCGDHLLNGSLNAAMKTGSNLGKWLGEKLS